MSNSIRINLFGTPFVESERGRLPAATAQRRRLGLLSAIALAAPAGISRERLLAMFWAELPEERARHNLAQLLYSLRRVLGDAAAIAGTDDLSLDRAVAVCDVHLFDAAADAGRHEDAVQLYSGPLLDGVHVPDAPGFDSWLVAERRRLAARFERALDGAAGAADARGDFGTALDLRKRRAAQDPLDSSAALALVDGFARAGDVASALRFARTHETLLREELSAPPPERFVARVRELASQSSSPAAAAPLRSVAPEEVSQVGSPQAASGASHEERVVRIVSGPRRIRLVAAGLGITALAVAAGVAWSGDSRGAHDARVLAIMPFETRGDTQVAYLADGFPRLLLPVLDLPGGFELADDRATLGFANGLSGAAAGPMQLGRRFGATYVLSGSIIRSGDRLRVNTELYDVSGDTARIVHRFSNEGGATHVFDLANEVGAELVAARFNQRGRDAVRSVAEHAPPWPALRAYLEGQSLAADRRYDDALRAYQRAVDADSTFARAYLQMALTAEYASRPLLVYRALRGAAAHAGHLSPFERDLLAAYDATYMGRYSEARQRYRALLEQRPTSVEAWFRFGELLFHEASWHGDNFLDARAPFERALALDPTDRAAMLHLARIAAWQGRTAEVVALAARAEALEPLDAEFRMLRAVARGSRDERQAALDLARHAGGTEVYAAAWRVAAFARDLDAAREIASVGLEHGRPLVDSGAALYALAVIDAAGGRVRAMRRRASQLALLDTVMAANLLGAAATVPDLGAGRAWADSAIAVVARQDTDAVARSDVPVFATYVVNSWWWHSRLLMEAAAVRGDTATVRRMARVAELPRRRKDLDLQSYEGWVSHAEVQRLRALGRGADAVRAFVATDSLPTPGELRFAIGDVALGAGMLDDAIRLLRSVDGQTLVEVMFYAPAARRLGEAYERAGRRRDAIEQYRMFLSLWRDADPEFAPLLAHARERLRALEAEK